MGKEVNLSLRSWLVRNGFVEQRSAGHFKLLISVYGAVMHVYLHKSDDLVEVVYFNKLGFSEAKASQGKEGINNVHVCITGTGLPYF
jgi:hypothetical protein